MTGHSALPILQEEGAAETHPNPDFRHEAQIAKKAGQGNHPLHAGPLRGKKLTENALTMIDRHSVNAKDPRAEAKVMMMEQ